MRGTEAAKLRLLVCDVDGTLTDGGIYYDSFGNEWKKFHVRDAFAFVALRRVGIEAMVLTGRECAATERRMRELGVDSICQGVGDKAAFLREFMEARGLRREQVAYIGDDLNDLAAMRLVGTALCPADACREVAALAAHRSLAPGGRGAVRELVEWLLRRGGLWERAVRESGG